MSSKLAEYDPKRTYNAAAVDYDTTSADFWRFAAEETVRRLDLAQSSRVLDVACGPGPAALAAARRIGPGGQVVGVDIAEEMLNLARGHAAQQGLTNVRFDLGSMDSLAYEDNSFEAATCVFGMFFAEDIVTTTRSMKDALVPGGQIAITTLGPKFFSPLYEVFLEAATAENPHIDTDVPWKRTEDPDQMAQYLAAAGVDEISVSHEVTNLHLSSPEDWWRIAMGTGIRRLVMELNEEQLARVRKHNMDWIREHSLDSVEFGVVYSRGHRR